MKTISDENYIAVHSAKNRPAAFVDSGETVVFKTRDCYNRTLLDLDRSFEEQTKDAIDNPATGPVFVNGAEPGDAIAVEILKIQVADRGCVVMGCGPFAEESRGKFYLLPIRGGKVVFKGIPIPVDPMVGVIGTAMADTDVPTMRAFPGGGNMDSRLHREGATVYLPVRVPGGLLSLGDVHALMGDGEVCGTGLEVDAVVTTRIRLVKHADLRWALTKTEDAWYVNTSGDTCDDAIRAGYLELRRLVSRAYGLSLEDAGFYLTLQCLLESNQACLEPRDTFRIGVPRRKDLPELLCGE